MTEKNSIDQAFDKVLDEKLTCNRTTLAYFGNFEDCIIYLIESGPNLWIWSILKGRDIVDMGTCESKDLCRFQVAKILGIGDEPQLEWTAIETEDGLTDTKFMATQDLKSGKKATLTVEKKDESSMPWEIKVLIGEESFAEGWAINRNAACLDAEHMIEQVDKVQVMKTLDSTILDEPKLEWTILEGENGDPQKIVATYDFHDDKAGSIAQVTVFVEKKDDSATPWQIKIMRGDNLFAEDWEASIKEAVRTAEVMVDAE